MAKYRWESSDIGKVLAAQLGWDTDQPLVEFINNRSTEQRMLCLSSATVDLLRSIHAELQKLPKHIADAVAKGEERVSKARVKAAQAEQAAKRDEAPVTVKQYQISDRALDKLVAGGHVRQRF